MTTARLHFPEGFIHSGKKWRACCHCGYATTPRVSRDRASEALDVDHGNTAGKCGICEVEAGHWRNPQVQFKPLVDGDQEIWVCRDDKACHERYQAARAADTLKCGCEQVWIAVVGHYHDAERPPLRVVQ